MIEQARQNAGMVICELYGRGFDFWKCVMDDPYNIEKVFYDNSFFKATWMEKIDLGEGVNYEKNRNDVEYATAKGYMKNRQYEQAIKILQKYSSKGLRAADFYLGKYYREQYEEAAYKCCIEGNNSLPSTSKFLFLYGTSWGVLLQRIIYGGIMALYGMGKTSFIL